MKKILIPLLFLIVAFNSFSQAKKPELMVMPAEVWCNQNEFMLSFENQGVQKLIPNYKQALQSSMELNTVIVKIGEIMAERGFPLKDLNATLNDLDQTEAENEMTQNKDGQGLSETPFDKLMNRAKADIIIEVAWSQNVVGPKRSVTFLLTGKDAYTNKQVASASGTGVPSFSAEVPLLLQEAVVSHMDNFTNQLQTYFDDMMTNGREVSLEIGVFDNDEDNNLETEFGDQELIEIIENWISDNTVNHRYSLGSATENKMIFNQVRIPLYNEKGRPMATDYFANSLRKYLKGEPYNIKGKVQRNGLGRARVILF